jgi:hypothetical protein
MKHLFTLADIRQDPCIDEGVEVLLQGQPFTDRVQVFVPIGFLNKSEDLASEIGAYVHGRRWARITRNDGYYIEIEVEDHEDNKNTSNQEPSNAPRNPNA